MRKLAVISLSVLAAAVWTLPGVAARTATGDELIAFKRALVAARVAPGQRALLHPACVSTADKRFARLELWLLDGRSVTDEPAAVYLRRDGRTWRKVSALRRSLFFAKPVPITFRVWRDLNRRSCRSTRATVQRLFLAGSVTAVRL